MAKFPLDKIRGFEMSIRETIRSGARHDEDNLYRELPFWLRIGPINWKFNECPYGWMLPNYNDYAED